MGQLSWWIVPCSWWLIPNHLFFQPAECFWYWKCTRYLTGSQSLTSCICRNQIWFRLPLSSESRWSSTSNLCYGRAHWWGWGPSGCRSGVGCVFNWNDILLGTWFTFTLQAEKVPDIQSISPPWPPTVRASCTVVDHLALQYYPSSFNASQQNRLQVWRCHYGLGFCGWYFSNVAHHRWLSSGMFSEMWYRACPKYGL